MEVGEVMVGQSFAKHTVHNGHCLKGFHDGVIILKFLPYRRLNF